MATYAHHTWSIALCLAFLLASTSAYAAVPVTVAIERPTTAQPKRSPQPIGRQPPSGPHGTRKRRTARQCRDSPNIHWSSGLWWARLTSLEGETDDPGSNLVR